MSKWHFLLLLLGLVTWPANRILGNPEEAPERSRCHVFIDFENIWTLEVVQDRTGAHVPILNIITLIPGTWEFRPTQIQIQGDSGRTGRVRRFSIDTGGEPYETEYMRVHGNSFIGLDLRGDFPEELAVPQRVLIDLGSDRFELQPVDCLDFDMLADRITRVNFDSPNIMDDFRVLGIESTGRRTAVPIRR